MEDASPARHAISLLRLDSGNANNEAMRAGDIIGVQGAGWLSDMIRRCTGDGPLSHIAVISATSPMFQVTEAIDRVKTRPLNVRLSESQKVWLLSPQFLTDDQRVVAAQNALGYSADDYGWGEIVLQGLDFLGKTEWWTEHLSGYYRNHPICSMLAALCEPEDGLPAISVTPNDFWRAAANPQRWVVTELK